MMNLVDSSAWLAYLTEEKNAEFFANAIEDYLNLIVPTIVIYEVFKKMLAEQGLEAAFLASAHMQRARVVRLDEYMAPPAARISREKKLGMADSIILATARTYGATIWTQDADFKEIEGIKYFAKK